MADNIEIGRRLKEARIASGFKTARAAAESLGVPYATYSQHENGTRGIVRESELYARRFKVSLDWLATGKGKGPNGRESTADSITETQSIDEARAAFEQAATTLAKLGVGAVEIRDWLYDALLSVRAGIVRQQLEADLQKTPLAQDGQHVFALPEGKKRHPGT